MSRRSRFERFVSFDEDLLGDGVEQILPPEQASDDLGFNAFCPTGKGGGVDATCSVGGKGPATTATLAPALSEKAARAKKAHKLVDARIQRYAEEHNEPVLAKALGGKSLKDNEPVDILVKGGGVELKTVVDNSNNKITMKRSAMEKKAAWERKNKTDMHTVVVDDSAVFNAKGEGKHDESKRKFFYRRGYGSFRIGTMHQVTDAAELKKLIAAPDAKLPEAARRPKGQRRGKLA